MSNASKSTTLMAAKILGAAKDLFARYGVQRTSMVDVAKAAGVSRPALYLHFHNKDELLVALGQMIVDDALASATAAYDPMQSVEENLKALILAKDLPLYRLLRLSPHGGELLAVDASLTARFAHELDAGFASILTRHARKWAKDGLVDLSAYGGAAAFGWLIAVTAAGLKHEMRGEADYLGAVAKLCRVFARAAQKA